MNNKTLFCNLKFLVKAYFQQNELEILSFGSKQVNRVHLNQKPLEKFRGFFFKSNFNLNQLTK